MPLPQHVLSVNRGMAALPAGADVGGCGHRGWVWSSWSGTLWHFFLLHPGKGKKRSSLLAPASIFSSLYTRRADRDVKADAHSPHHLLELEAMRAVGQAAGLGVPSHRPSTHTQRHHTPPHTCTHICVYTYTCSHIDMHIYIHTYTERNTFTHKDS